MLSLQHHLAVLPPPPQTPTLPPRPALTSMSLLQPLSLNPTAPSASTPTQSPLHPTSSPRVPLRRAAGAGQPPPPPPTRQVAEEGPACSPLWS